jgi:hypothetical protein
MWFYSESDWRPGTIPFPKVLSRFRTSLLAFSFICSGTFPTQQYLIHTGYKYRGFDHLKTILIVGKDGHLDMLNGQCKAIR